MTHLHLHPLPFYLLGALLGAAAIVLLVLAWGSP